MCCITFHLRVRAEKSILCRSFFICLLDFVCLYDVTKCDAQMYAQTHLIVTWLPPVIRYDRSGNPTPPFAASRDLWTAPNLLLGQCWLNQYLDQIRQLIRKIKIIKIIKIILRSSIFDSCNDQFIGLSNGKVSSCPGLFK